MALHTVLKDSNDDRRRVLVEPAELSARVVVMTERARSFLRDIHDVPDARIDVIAHGSPDSWTRSRTKSSSGSRVGPWH